MPIDSRERRQEAAPVLLPWGMPAGDGSEGIVDALAVSLGGGLVVLLAWTGLALLLTA
jgi:hypothetical protein